MSRAEDTVRNSFESELIELLQLDLLDEDTSDQILLDLVNHGRQSLVRHQEDILEDIYENVMSEDSQLTKILKTSIYNSWSSNFFSSYPWFRSFIEEYQSKSVDLYDRIISRTAEYGRKRFMNSSDNGEQLLFIVIQFLFNLTDERIMDGYTFNRIWYTLIIEGFEGIQQLAELIDLNQIKNEEKILLQALREYFRPELFSILSKCNIMDRRDLYPFILDQIGRYGWRLGLDRIRTRITPRMFKELRKHVETIVPAPQTIDSTKETWENKYLTCRDQLLDLKSWNEAGEFHSLSSLIKTAIDRYCQHKTYTLFLQDCFIPIMYLLKRQENLEYFLQLLEQSCYRLGIDSVNIHLRTLIHALLCHSDESLRRMILNQLNQQNSVPFLQPGSLDINCDILSIWDLNHPCLLSFGIGPCPGKSTLLNELFHTKFERHRKEHLYFEETIDIDFGVNVSSHALRVHIADAHGMITKECLRKFQVIFQGYLIHIDEHFLKQNPSLLNDYLSLLESRKFRLVIVHNSKTKNKISFTKQSLVLPQTRPNTDCSSRPFLMNEIRDEMNKRFEEIVFNEDKISKNLEKLSVDYQCMNTFVTKCLKKLSMNKKPSENELDFPYYVKFVNVCYQRRKQREQVFLEAKEKADDERIKLDGKDCEEKLPSLGTGFEIFLEILQLPTARRLHVLDYLSSKLHDGISLEVFWRNTIICCAQCSSPFLQTSVVNAYLGWIETGYSFEILDGDNFYFQHRFLKKVFTSLTENKEQKVFIISIIGSKQSGKSTLLQYMFGIRNQARLTRGFIIIQI